VAVLDRWRGGGGARAGAEGRVRGEFVGLSTRPVELLHRDSGHYDGNSCIRGLRTTKSQYRWARSDLFA